MKIILNILFILSVICSFGQNNKIDSLIKISKNSKDKITIYNQISWEYFLISMQDEAIDFANKSLALNKKSDKQRAQSYHYIALSESNKGNFEKSIKTHFKSLKVKEENNDTSGVIASYVGLGNDYFSLDKLKSSEKFYLKALDLSRKIDYVAAEASVLMSLGNINFMRQNNLLARKYYLKALKIEKKLNNIYNLALLYNNLGNVYFLIDKYESEFYYKKGAEYQLEIGELNGLSDSYYNLSLIYKEFKQFDKSVEYLRKAENVAREIDSKDALKNCYIGYADVYDAMGQNKLALEYYKKFTILKDTILKQESSENINKLSVLYETEKQNKTIELLNKEREKQELVNKLSNQKNRIISISITLVLIITLVFSFWLYKRYKKSIAQNLEIEKQKKEAVYHKNIIEKKQKEIEDSINYARRIQNSFIASEQDFKDNVKENFILFLPKDIVSGDFYWANTLDDKFYLCVADSTGHGIPGAFMSLLNISLLNEALLSKHLLNTNEILEFVRKILILGLKKDDSGDGGKDGMDCTLIAIDKKKKTLQLSGAFNPLWILRENEILDFKTDRMPVGRSPMQDTTFSSQTIELQENDMIYLFTDGFQDQFGGPENKIGGKKFKSKRLKEILLENSNSPLALQREKLLTAFNSWKGELEQIDDVCVIGIKI